MDKLFLEILNMSITSSYVILFIILIRFLLKKVPKIYSYTLWSVVLLRLTIPFSIQSIFSLIRINTKAIPKDIMYTELPQINSGITVIDSIVNNSLPARVLVASANPMQLWIAIGQSIWILGLIILMIYSIVTTIKLSKKLKSATHISNNIYENSIIKTPFVFGLVNPKIYLPKDLSEIENGYIIKHEQTHIERKDHIIKFIAFLVVSIHWFNPLVWLSFFLMTEDMELSCDEKVIQELGSGIKKDYSNSLLSLSTGRRIIGGSPIAFGENNTKGRIKNVLNYKKPEFWVSIVTIILIVAVGIGLISNPREEITNNIESMKVKDYAVEFVDSMIKGYENQDGLGGGFKIIESKIISLDRVSSFDDILSGPVELWSIEYRLKPEDMSNVIIAGGVEEIDGWITENGSMGKPLLAFTYEGDVTKYLGPVYTAELGMTSLAGQETAIRIMLENNNILPNETYKGNHIVMKFPASTGEAYQLLLSQPVVQGSKGIWAVERWMDGNGNIYYEYPETDIKMGDYYKNLQQQFEKGENPSLGDFKEVGYDFIKNRLGQTGVKRGNYSFKVPSTIEDFLETPISLYIGYIAKIELDDSIIHIDRVEFIGADEKDRLKDLNIDPDTLDNGYYIYNPDSYPDGLFVTEDTEYNLLNSKSIPMKNIVVTKTVFYQYLQDVNNTALFNIYTKDGGVTKIEEIYLP
jgi:beta-lactamase regulating signal transducer with metallopeptidase domain